MLKKLLFIPLSAVMFFACAGLQESKNMINCRYDIVKAEVTDYDINSISMDLAIAITNVNKSAAAAVTRFDGSLYINDTNVSAITLKDVRVEAGQTKVVNSKLEIPLQNLGKGLAGLVSMGSVSVNYVVKGTIYFSTPLGELPFPVVIYQSKKF